MGRTVNDLMQSSVITIAPGASVARAAATMRKRHVECLPVVEHERVIGMVTTQDMLGVLANHL